MPFMISAVCADQACIVPTDSGGVREETTVLAVRRLSCATRNARQQLSTARIK
jgi:UDP-N-acetylglucosamine 2-epimerase